MNPSIIQRVHITEKSANMQGTSSKYVFLVEPKATKSEIKKAIKALYKVDTISIRTLHEQPLRRRYRGVLSLKQAPKKAIVTLKEGQKIDLT